MPHFGPMVPVATTGEVFEGFTLAVAFIIGLGQLEMALDLLGKTQFWNNPRNEG